MGEEEQGSSTQPCMCSRQTESRIPSNESGENAIDTIITDTENNNNNNILTTERQGTTASARFNILATMVGGGSLSLPLAFQKSGNALLGPILLVLTALLSDFCFGLLIRSARRLQKPRPETVGRDSFESITAVAFGPVAHYFSALLVIFMCFFASVGYAVLLRDMLQPWADWISAALTSEDDDHSNNTTLTSWLSDKDSGDDTDPAVPSVDGPSFAHNIAMLVVILLVTPLCGLRTLTALQRFGAASMMAVLVLGLCVCYRSVQCLMRQGPDWYHAYSLLPPSDMDGGMLWRNVLDAFPLFISCYVCHYNIPTVHNDLRNPTRERVQWWLRSTTGSATLFYCVLGVLGSGYGPCCTSNSNGHVQGNILLDLDPHDLLLWIGRTAFALTLALAFPMLTIPARDIILRFLLESSSSSSSSRTTATAPPSASQDELREPLLPEQALTTDQEVAASTAEAFEDEPASPETTDISNLSWSVRMGMAVAFLWTSAALASCVSSIDIVWDLLGSSLSIILSVLIPCGSFLVIVQPTPALDGAAEPEGEPDATVADEEENEGAVRMSRKTAWGLIAVFVPLMVVSTVNAVVNTFFL